VNKEWKAAAAALFVCGTPLASDEGMVDVLNANAAKAKQLLQEAGYDGTPVELMQSTDLTVLTNMAPVAKAQLEAAGFKVNMQSMDWQTLVARRAKKDPPDKGGWNAFLTSSASVDIVDPLANTYINAIGENAWFGWPKDDELVKLRVDADSPADRFAVADEHDLGAVAQQRRNRARDRGARREVASHRVDGDPHRSVPVRTGLQLFWGTSTTSRPR